MLDALADAVRRLTDARPGENPVPTAVDGFVLLRADHEKPPNHLVFRPALCVTVQGAKWTTFGDRRLDYRAGQALVVSVETPAVGRVTEASPDKPYLGVAMELDLAVMRDVADGLDEPPGAGAGRGVFVIDLDEDLAGCILRVMRLLGTPKAIPTLYPAIMREVCYRLLTGPNGAGVARMTLGAGRSQPFARAIHALRDRFAQPVRVEELAGIARLSASAFHRRFKALTSTTPLQYQKQLRLLEARRLMASSAMKVEAAAFQVGYESPSQFSREYSRMFGTPPRRDASSLKPATARA